MSWVKGRASRVEGQKSVAGLRSQVASQRLSAMGYRLSANGMSKVEGRGSNAISYRLIECRRSRVAGQKLSAIGYQLLDIGYWLFALSSTLSKRNRHCERPEGAQQSRSAVKQTGWTGRSGWLRFAHHDEDGVGGVSACLAPLSRNGRLSPEPWANGISNVEGQTLSAIDYRLSTISYRLSTIDYQLFAISYRLSTNPGGSP
jgi:hypothetical protein